jgi:pimeloyl-ACP methyl ester carboxylesterase
VPDAGRDAAPERVVTAAVLPPAIIAQELTWNLPDAGRVLCYHRPGAGRPLLLLHSINAAPSAFEVSPFFDRLSLDRPLYAPDLPGFGRSARTDRPYRPEFFATAIQQMIDAIGADSVDVLALSTTSEFAACAALREPERIASLVLVSPTGLSRRRDEPSKAGPKVLRVFRTPGVGSTLYRLLRTRPSIRFFLDKAFEDGAPDAMVDYACRTTRVPGASNAPFYFLSGQMFAPDAVGDLYLPLKQPVLVLYDQDPNISFDYLDQVLEEGRAWQAERIPGTRGLPHFEKPAETQRALETFWRRLDG